MSPEDFKQVLGGHERAGVEFKPAGPRKGELLGKVIRAILGMANFRDGGHVVLGVGENSDKTPLPVGLTPEELDSWNFDDTSAAVSAHADPFVTFTREVHGDPAGRRFVLLEVREFDPIPVLCKREFPHPTYPKKPILRAGGCYVRTRKKPETTEIASQTEMRELLDLAIDKGLREFIRRAVLAGAFPNAGATASPTDDDLFSDQLGDLK